MVDLVGKRYLWYAISLLVIVPGAVALIAHGLTLGIDFTGGTSWEFQMERAPAVQDIRAILDAHGFTGSVIQVSHQDNTVQIRMKELKEGSPEKAAITSDFAQRLGPIKAGTEQFS